MSLPFWWKVLLTLRSSRMGAVVRSTTTGTPAGSSACTMSGTLST
jgi:hypothetical protein